jgi:hypothetical protein
MAITHLYTVVGEYAMRGQDGKTTVAGIFHNIEGRSLPIPKIGAAIAVAFSGEEGDEYKVTVDRPDQTCLLEVGQGTVHEPSGLREHQQWSVTAIGIANLSFDQIGVHHVTLWGAGQPVHQYPIGVMLTEGLDGAHDHDQQ